MARVPPFGRKRYQPLRDSVRFVVGQTYPGTFTWAFLEALRGGATADAENLVRLGSVAEYVAGRVTAWTKENQRKPQSPFLKSPVATRNLPLAAKADDLTTLLASLQRQPASGGFTVAMRDDLVAYLRKLDGSNPEDRELLSAPREFLRGKLRANFFVAYVERDRNRWRISRMGGARAGEVRKFSESPSWGRSPGRDRAMSARARIIRPRM